MKLLGILGGMSWTSTAEYYRLLNEGVARELGGLHSARLLLHSVDFAEVAALQRTGDWDAIGALMADGARGLERAGAQGLLMATNTIHKMADEIQDAVSIPLLHIADATGERIRAAGPMRVGLLATAFTMEQDFYTGRLARKYGLDVIVPEAEERADVHRIIFDELCVGNIRPESRETSRRIMARLVQRGAQAIILGCTEITLLVGQDDTTVPVFDTTRIHVQDAVRWMLDATAAVSGDPTASQ